MVNHERVEARLLLVWNQNGDATMRKQALVAFMSGSCQADQYFSTTTIQMDASFFFYFHPPAKLRISFALV